MATRFRFVQRYLAAAVEDDLRDKMVFLAGLLVNALPERVGAPLSVRNLGEDLGVAHATVARWLAILEALYVCFRIPRSALRASGR